MQPLALCEAAMAVCYVCPCTMLHASEVPYRHPGEVTSRSSRRPLAASARASKMMASISGIKTSVPTCSSMVTSQTRFCIHLHRCSVSDML